MKLWSRTLLLALLLGAITQLDYLLPNFIKEHTANSTEVVDRNGRTLRLTLSADDKFRLWSSLESINPVFVKAILQKEDQYFFYHFGINPVSFLKAMGGYLTGENRGGASTITMQLARLYYKINTKTVWGKLKQTTLALALELALTKEEILESYLNLIPMGKNIEGIETACKYYFGKASQDVKRFELLFLSLLPQSPGRIKYLLAKKNAQVAKLLKPKLPDYSIDEISSYFSSLKVKKKRAFLAPHFVNYVLSQDPNVDHIKTSLDLELQLKLEEILTKYVDDSKSKGIFNASNLIINSETGEIVSYIGSKDFYNAAIDGQVDGILAKRSPGSTLKPLIYALGFSQGLNIPKSIIYDSPLPYRTPENFDKVMNGPMTVEQALITSRNIPAVAINAQLTNPNFFEFLQMVGVSSSHNKDYYGSSIALGAYEVNMLQLAQLYSLIAENGRFQAITSSVAAKGKQDINMLSPEASILVKSILKKHSRPNYQTLGKFVDKHGEVYWKTGTSFGYRDAWATGIWGKYVIITWLGDFRSRGNPYLVGSQTAGPLFFKMIDYLRHHYEFKPSYDLKHNFNNNITEIDVCTVSGKIPNEHCPHKVTSLFIPNVSPVEKCRTHRKVKLATKSGLRSCNRYTGTTYEKVFEFFSTEKKQIYKRFGLRLTLPPAFEPICGKQVQTHLIGERPKILSPKKGQVYLIEDNTDLLAVPVKAKADSDVHRLSWYVDDRLVMKSRPNEFKSIKLAPGSYALKIVDDKGRVDSRLLNIENANL